MTPAQRPADDGFTLLEVVVAMTVFVVMSAAVLGVLLGALTGTRSNAQRVQAANLAAQQVEAARSLGAGGIPDGITSPVGNPVTIDGTAYSIVQTATYLTGDGSASTCSSTGSRLTYKRVAVTVTWSNMQSVKPVRSDTLVAVSISKDDVTRGAAAVLVRGASAQPRAGVLITLGGQSRSTDDAGCAVFAGLAPGDYLVAVNTPGLVGIDGAQTQSATVGVVAGAVSRQTIDYDQAGHLAVDLQAPGAGYTAPAQLPLTLDYANFNPTNPRALQECPASGSWTAPCVAGTPRTVDSLYPGSYAVWAGSCADAEPVPAPSRLHVDAGTTQRGTTSLAGVAVQVSGTAGTPHTVYASHHADARCATTVTYPLGTATTGATVRAALPAGTWYFSLDGASTTDSDAHTTLTAGVVSASPIVLVGS